MRKKRNKIIIWSTDVIRLIEGKPIGGLAVQMYFWAQTFAQQGWEVISFAENEKKTIVKENIIFNPKRNIQRINILLEWWHAIKFVLIDRPQYIIYRGANREILPLSMMARLLGVKFVFFAASDVNFEPGKELVGSERNRRMYHHSIRQIKYFVVQNNHQHDTLLRNYGKESLILYNIWGTAHLEGQDTPPESDAVWVANFRKLKRAEWVLDAAEKQPDAKFVMAGSAGNDALYYEKMEKRAESIENVDFLGGRSFFYVNELVGKSKVLLCTSTFEGFPNTFLQAWSKGLPVISTVDPSDVIKKHNLGIVVENVEELSQAIYRVLNDKDYYKELQQNVATFFFENHSANNGFNKLMTFIS